MDWKRKSAYRIESPAGYTVAGYRQLNRATGMLEITYVSYVPGAGHRTVYSGLEADAAKAACDRHLAASAEERRRLEAWHKQEGAA